MEKSKFQTLEELAKKYETRTSWVRQAWGKVMSAVEKISVDDTVCVFTGIEEDGFDQYICLGEKDSRLYIGGDEFVTRANRFSQNYSWEKMKISDLRYMLEHLPEYIQKLRGKLQGGCDAIDELKKNFAEIFGEEVKK